MPVMSDLRDRLLAIFAEHRAALTRFLTRRLGSATLAEDLTQETWVRVATASTVGTTAADNPRSYLFRIAANLAIDHQRHAHRGVEIEAPAPVLDAVADPAPSPEIVALHRSEMARLLRAVDQLPPRCRQVFLLTKVHELSYAEVAVRLGISRNTVMVHMVNALAALDAHLAPSDDA
ncbi:RNA polymerase sigma factor [Reyranella sp. CPCC 100927]|nr:RNA polymerase sigma factor [Reyranella sp. CPCC 100927]